MTPYIQNFLQFLLGQYMTPRRQFIFSVFFIVLFAVVSVALVLLSIRQARIEKSQIKMIREVHRRFTSQRLCALIVMVPATFQLIINAYYQIYLRPDRGIYWFPLIDLLFIMTALFVFFGLKIQWSIFVVSAFQIYSFSLSVLRHINIGFSVPLVRFTLALVYYIVVICVLLRVMYPGLFGGQKPNINIGI